MALVSKPFADIITFTRASTATYFDATGTLRSAAINAPRFDYDPATLAARGFLIEEQRTNLLTYSEQFDNAAWGKTGLNTTGTPPWVDVAVAPDGNTTADKLTEDTSTGEHAVNQTFSFTAGTTYTMSLFAKAAERTLIRVGAGNPATWDAGVIVDLTTGTITSTIGGSGYVQDVGNGWYRISVTGNALLTAATGRSIRLVLTGTTINYTGDGTSGLYVWGAQFEVGAFPTSYIPTTTTALTRSADVASVNTLSPWFNASSGTIYADFSVSYDVAASTFPLMVSFDDNTTPNRIVATSRTIDDRAAFSILSGGVSQASLLSNNTITYGVAAKYASAYAVGDAATALNGVLGTLGTPAVIPSGISYMRLGNAISGSVSYNTILNGHLRRVTYYPRRLSNAELQAITA